MRLSLPTRFCVLLLVFSFVSTVATAQRLKPKEGSGDSDHDTDRAAERLMWFMDSRLTPDGKAPAEKALNAHERKMQLRSEREKRLVMSTADPNATVPVGGVTSAWTPIGPAPILSDGLWGQVTGRIAAVTVDQSDTTGNTVLIGGAFGGIWRSGNAASANPAQVTWTPLIDSQSTLAVGAISLRPTNSSTILVGTGEAKSAIDSYYGRGILRSTDGGTTWTNIKQTVDSTPVTFTGLGFAKFAWSTTNTSLVVAATTSTGIGNRNGAMNIQGFQSGLFYSTDAGATWRKATMQDGPGQTVSAAAHSVVFNPSANKFYAAIRFHGLYESTDGQTFTRMGTQPDAANLTLASCPSSGSSSCPFYRGELAVVPGRNEMYVWYTQGTSTLPSGNRGVFYTVDGGANWRTLDKSGMDTCGDSQGCSASQGYFYNMAIAAVPAGTQTDLYLGAVNAFKCRIDPTSPTSLCNGAEPNKFMNLTHVYGNPSTCGWGGMATFHPDNHSYDFSRTNPNIVYFGNDGGIYRTLTSQSIATGVCTTTKQPFQNLNNSSLSLTQYVWGSAHPTDSSQFLGGAQDNGTSLTYDAIKGANGQQWKPIFGGDGGYNAFRPDDGNTLIISYVNANLFVCSGLGVNCDQSAWPQLIDPSDLKVSGTNIEDSSPFYTVWELDKRAPSKLVIGTCRVWRGSSTASWGTTPGTAISGKLHDASGQLDCANSDSQIYALATGGPAGTGGVATVIYAGLNNGLVWRTSDADAATPNWNNVTPPASLNPGPNWQGSGFRISSIAISPSDASGNTAYLTIQGFNLPHVLKTTNGGASWTDITGNLPDAPANSVTVDPDDSTVLYVGTDVGVFSTTNAVAGAIWTEVGGNPAQTPNAYLPNVVVNRVLINKVNATKTLYAVTYGRGVWKTDLSSTSAAPFLQLQDSTGTPIPTLTFANQRVGTTSAGKAVRMVNIGTATLNISAIVSFTGDYTRADDCGTFPKALAPNAYCTVTISFAPTASGTRTGNMTVASDSSSGANTQLNMTGTGTTPPNASVAPTTLDWGKVNKNSTPANKTFTITNTGTETLTISSIATFGYLGEYNVTYDCGNMPATLASNTLCTVTVAFQPTTTGTHDATVVVTSNSGGTAGTQHTVVLKGTAEDFGTPAVANTSVTVAKGGSANFGTVTIPAAGGYSSAITMSCTGLPSRAQCNFAPNPIQAPGNAAATTQLTISTQVAGGATMPLATGTGHKLLVAFWLVMPGLALLLPTAAGRRKHNWVRLGVISIALLVVAGMAACGGGGGGSPGGPAPNPGTPAGTYTVTVTATNGTLSHSTSVALTVQ